MAGADEEREEAGRVEEGVDAQDDARVADLEVLSAMVRGMKLGFNRGISRFSGTKLPFEENF